MEVAAAVITVLLSVKTIILKPSENLVVEAWMTRATPAITALSVLPQITW